MRNLGEAWEEWRRATRVPLSAEVMVTDRDEDASAVLKWLRGPPAHLAVQAGSTEEATAFPRAALDDLPEDHRLTYESRCLVAADADIARDLVGIGTPLVIVLPDGEAGLVQHLVADGHHVYAAHGPAALRAGNARALPRPWRHNLQVALVRMGISEEDAHQLSRGSGRSLAILRRLMPAAPTFLPHWAADPPAELIAAMLAGSWNQTSAADRKVVASIAGRPYELFEESLTALTIGQEPPLLRSGAMWKLVSLRDAWTLLAPRLSAIQLRRFERAFHEVFSTRNPRFHVAGRKTWYERHGEFGDEVSPELRRGLAEAMVALGVYPEAVRAAPDAAGRAEQAVRNLLGAADAELWWSLSGDFRRLAEASPRAFLDAVEWGLDHKDRPVMALFRSDEGLMTRTEYLADLLWALEMLARSPDHLLQSALLLARLDSVDPGGKWGNRPGASLRRILLSWSPQTYAGPEQRLKVVDAIAKRFPQVGWNLLVRLAPRAHDTSDFSPMPDWRDACVVAAPTLLALALYAWLFGFALYRDPSRAHLVALLYLWQTQVAGVLAIGAALLGAAAVLHQTGANRQREMDQLARRAGALRAAMPMIIDGVSQYAFDCARVYDEPWRAGCDPIVQRPAAPFPDLPPGIVDAVVAFLETIGIGPGGRQFTTLLRDLQIYRARARDTSYRAEAGNTSILVRHTLIGRAVDSASIYARCERLFVYARSMALTEVGDITSADVEKAVRLLPVNSIPEEELRQEIARRSASNHVGGERWPST